MLKQAGFDVEGVAFRRGIRGNGRRTSPLPGSRTPYPYRNCLTVLLKPPFPAWATILPWATLFQAFLTDIEATNGTGSRGPSFHPISPESALSSNIQLPVVPNLAGQGSDRSKPMKAAAPGPLQPWLLLLHLTVLVSLPSQDGG